MAAINDYILAAIRRWVWSGFYNPGEVDEMIDDILEDGADEEMLRSAVLPEFTKKKQAESIWPETTDCDRLDEAFKQLNQQGIIALHNAGVTMSDGLSDVGEALHIRGRGSIRGYCFYHAQDIERALAGEGLLLAYGDLDDDPAAASVIGKETVACLKDVGLSVDWAGDSGSRIFLDSFDWKRRSDK